MDNVNKLLFELYLKLKIQFIKEGEQNASDRISQPGSYFDNAKDWKIQVDLKTQVQIPTEITIK